MYVIVDFYDVDFYIIDILILCVYYYFVMLKIFLNFDVIFYFDLNLLLKFMCLLIRIYVLLILN